MVTGGIARRRALVALAALVSVVTASCAPPDDDGSDTTADQSPVGPASTGGPPMAGPGGDTPEEIATGTPDETTEATTTPPTVGLDAPNWNAVSAVPGVSRVELSGDDDQWLSVRVERGVTGAQFIDVERAIVEQLSAAEDHGIELVEIWAPEEYLVGIEIAAGWTEIGGAMQVLIDDPDPAYISVDAGAGVVRVTVRMADDDAVMPNGIAWIEPLRDAGVDYLLVLTEELAQAGAEDEQAAAHGWRLSIDLDGLDSAAQIADLWSTIDTGVATGGWLAFTAEGSAGVAIAVSEVSQIEPMRAASLEPVVSRPRPTGEFTNWHRVYVPDQVMVEFREETDTWVRFAADMAAPELEEVADGIRAVGWEGTMRIRVREGVDPLQGIPSAEFLADSPTAAARDLHAPEPGGEERAAPFLRAWEATAGR